MASPKLKLLKTCTLLRPLVVEFGLILHTREKEKKFLDQKLLAFW
jgi:hypothetical protein